MSVIAAEKLEKHFGARVLFRDADFTLDEGCRVGLIGANGAGKTSLFRILLGADDDHDGRVARRRDLRIAALEQDPRFPDGAAALEAMLSADAELVALEHGMHEIHEALQHDVDLARRSSEGAKAAADTQASLLDRLGRLQARFEARNGWEIKNRAERILDGVGFPRDLREAPVASLSGGERGRLAFARILLQEPDLWLLDEPTNHLDIDGILFLERFLRESKASAVVISHDRRFLDRVTEETWEIEDGRFWRYPAPYSRARALREERLKAARREFEVQRTFVEKEESFIRRYGAGQRARQAQGRMKRLERLERLERPEDRVRVMNLRLSAGERPGAKVLALRGVAAGYGERMLFRGLDLDLPRGETLGVAGPNGAGKTTLMGILTGAIAPVAGEVLWGERTSAGALSQHEQFPDEAATPYSFLRACAPRLTEQQIRNLLGAMLFPGESVDRPVAALSGGERKRLMLTRLLVEGRNVLLLDEPTNHLDIPSREALELALAAYEGTLIVVSHDRHFVDLMADRMLWIEDGEVHLTEGGFTEALKRRELRRAAAEHLRNAAAAAEQARLRASGASAMQARNAAGASAHTSAAKPPPKSPLGKLRTEEIEARIAGAEERLKELEAAFATPEIYRDPARVKAHQAELAAVQAKLAALEEEWLARSR